MSRVCKLCASTGPFPAQGLRCRKCIADASRAWYAANPKRANLNSRRGHYEREYGLSLDAVRALETRNPDCEVCGVSFSLVQRHIDHCHTTGKVRGLLCTNCNRGIGHLKDSPALLAAAIRYLEKHMSQQEGSRR